MSAETVYVYPEVIYDLEPDLLIALGVCRRKKSAVILTSLYLDHQLESCILEISEKTIRCYYPDDNTDNRPDKSPLIQTKLSAIFPQAIIEFVRSTPIDFDQKYANYTASPSSRPTNLQRQKELIEKTNELQAKKTEEERKATKESRNVFIFAILVGVGVGLGLGIPPLGIAYLGILIGVAVIGAVVLAYSAIQQWRKTQKEKAEKAAATPEKKTTWKIVPKQGYTATHTVENDPDFSQLSAFLKNCVDEKEQSGLVKITINLNNAKIEIDLKGPSTLRCYYPEGSRKPELPAALKKFDSAFSLTAASKSFVAVPKFRMKPKNNSFGGSPSIMLSAPRRFSKSAPVLQPTARPTLF